MMMYVLADGQNIFKVTHSKQFFLRLSELFDERRQKDHGSVHLTQKSNQHCPIFCQQRTNKARNGL